MLKLSKYYYTPSDQWMMKSAPPPLPQAYRDECLSSRTGVMELAVTDSGALQ